MGKKIKFVVYGNINIKNGKEFKEFLKINTIDMEIEYLKSLDQNKTGKKLWKYSDPKGLSIQTIEDMENKVNNGKAFPKAFREFLFLAGDISAISLGPAYDTAWGLENGDDYVESINVYKRLMAKEGLSLSRPFVVINSGDDSYFAFIYLDEGDNPRPRTYNLDYPIGIVDMPEKTFSELIDRLVNSALNGWTPW